MASASPGALTTVPGIGPVRAGQVVSSFDGCSASSACVNNSHLADVLSVVTDRDFTSIHLNRQLPINYQKSVVVTAILSSQYRPTRKGP